MLSTQEDEDVKMWPQRASPGSCGWPSSRVCCERANRADISRLVCTHNYPTKNPQTKVVNSPGYRTISIADAMGSENSHFSDAQRNLSRELIVGLDSRYCIF